MLHEIYYLDLFTVRQKKLEIHCNTVLKEVEFNKHSLLKYALKFFGILLGRSGNEFRAKEIDWYAKGPGTSFFLI